MIPRITDEELEKVINLENKLNAIRESDEAHSDEAGICEIFSLNPLIQICMTHAAAKYVQWIIEARKVLKEVEWSYCIDNGLGDIEKEDLCPVCKRDFVQCHLKDCALAALLNDSPQDSEGEQNAPTN